MLSYTVLKENIKAKNINNVFFFFFFFLSLGCISLNVASPRDCCFLCQSAEITII